MNNEMKYDFNVNDSYVTNIPTFYVEGENKIVDYEIQRMNGKQLFEKIESLIDYIHEREVIFSTYNNFSFGSTKTNRETLFYCVDLKNVYDRTIQLFNDYLCNAICVSKYDYNDMLFLDKLILIYDNSIRQDITKDWKKEKLREVSWDLASPYEKYFMRNGYHFNKFISYIKYLKENKNSIKKTK